MMLLRYLEEVKLYKTDKEKQPNGTFKNKYIFLKPYKVQKKVLDDEVSASIYGANINKMYSISTPLKDLETYLQPKVDNKDDNISDYYIEYKNHKYKITSVKEESIIIERL